MALRQGKEQFRRMITEFRNKHIIALMRPLLVMRTELIANDEMGARGGTDDPTQTHLMNLLINCDKWRRNLTHNPDKLDLGSKIAKAIDSKATITIGENPFGGDDIQNQSGGIVDLIWAFDGTNPDIPLMSQLKDKFMQAPGGMLLLAIDDALVKMTQLNSKDRTRFITANDSFRVYGSFQEILGAILTYLGDENRIDVAQLLPSEQAQGPSDSPNIKGESAAPSGP